MSSSLFDLLLFRVFGWDRLIFPVFSSLSFSLSLIPNSDSSSSSRIEESFEFLELIDLGLFWLILASLENPLGTCTGTFIRLKLLPNILSNVGPYQPFLQILTEDVAKIIFDLKGSFLIEGNPLTLNSKFPVYGTYLISVLQNVVLIPFFLLYFL